MGYLPVLQSSRTVEKFSSRNEIIEWFLSCESILEPLWDNLHAKKVISPLTFKFSCTGTLRRLQEITCLVIYAKLFKIKTVCFRIFKCMPSFANICRRPLMTSTPQISHMVISKDAAIIAMATNSRTISLWTPVERREIANYRTTFDITDLQMTCDCHKVVVRGLGPEKNQILEIFDILNVDDILTHVAGRRQLQQIERTEHLASERKTNRQQREKSSNNGKP